MLTIQTIVTRPRGTWKYQDAYAVATYAPHTTRDGRVVWQNVGRGPKRSMPQLRRYGYAGLPVGGPKIPPKLL